MSIPWLEAKALTFGFGQAPLFHRLSFQVETRGIVHLQGPSGSGKTTLANLLCGHLSPDAGAICIDGAVVLRACRRAILASQEDDLFPWLRMREQLDFCAALPAAMRDWRPLASLVGLGEASELYPAQMSGGMKKRLSLLRATVLAPALLVLDETFASLEPPLREQILREFAPIWSRARVGVLLISHDAFPGLEALIERRISIAELRARAS